MQSLGKILILFKGWMQAEIAAQASRILLWVPVLLAVGVAVYFQRLYDAPIYIACIAITGLIVLWLRYNSPVARVVVVAVLIFCCGYLAAQYRTFSVSQHVSLIDKDVNFATVRGQVRGFEYLSPQGGQARLTIADAQYSKDKGQSWRSVHGDLRLTVRSKDKVNIQAGDQVQGLAKLLAISDPVVPNGYDFRRHFFFQSIAATGYFYGAPKVTVRASGSDIEAQRGMFERYLLSSHAGDDVSPVMAALFLGKKAAIPDRVMQAFRDSGLAHVLAISGMHIGLVMGGIFVLLRLIMSGVPYVRHGRYNKAVAALIALAVAAIYMLLAGASIPTQRSILMAGVVCFAVLFSRQAISLRVVAFAATLLLLLAPESLLSASFQLSFAAVIALVAFYEWFQGRFAVAAQAGFLHRFGVFFAGVAVTSLLAAVATGFYSAYHFHTVALYGVLANMIAVPLLTFIVMPFGLLGMVLDAAPLLSNALLQLAALALRVIIDVAIFVSDLDGAVLHVKAMDPIYLPLVSLLMLGVCLCVGRIRFVFLAVATVFTGVAAFSSDRPVAMVSQDFKLYGVFAADNFVDRFEDNSEYSAYGTDKAMLFISHLRRKSFDADQWRRFLGASSEQVQHFSSARILSCDDLACRAALSAGNISFVKNAAAIEAECSWADLVVFPYGWPFQDSCNAQILHRGDSKRRGGLYIYPKSREAGFFITGARDGLIEAAPWR